MAKYNEQAIKGSFSLSIRMGRTFPEWMKRVGHYYAENMKLSKRDISSIRELYYTMEAE